jgi:hypothetical protein
MCHPDADGRSPELLAELVIADKLYNLPSTRFDIDEMT